MANIVVGIDPKELRILNWVNMDGEPYQIRAGEQIDDFSDRMKPMRLTHQIFEKVGFVEKSKLYELEFDSAATGIAIIYTSFEIETQTLVIEDARGESINIKRPDYLHQLQNIVYYFTGQELNISL